jgi:L-seryl-tRNA(Ser) seleniumtransferase
LSKRAETDSPSARAHLGAVLRRIPSVERVLTLPDVGALEETFGRSAVVEATRQVLDELRERAMGGKVDESELARALDALRDSIAHRLEIELSPSLKPAINATGVIIHTNLGRSPLSAQAVEALGRVARGYSNLELDLASGRRGSRHQHASRLLAQLFPNRSALVVNNAAAAVMLSLNTFAAGKEVIISRGELVEIGGSFRVPDILARSGARLREVGTTNKTRLSDYEEAIGPETGALLRVHPSNFRIVGFTESASTEELVRLGREKGLTVIEDFGSGNLVSLREHGLPNEPTVFDSLESGVHLSIFSGDKLLGGPQAGILIGDDDAVTACRRNPMARALRVDKLAYAALEATLSSFVRGRATQEIPVLRMITMNEKDLARRAESLREQVHSDSELRFDVVATMARVGGGAAADAELASFALSVESQNLAADDLLLALRQNDPPIIGRIVENRVLLDVRTIDATEEPTVVAALQRIGIGKPAEPESSGPSS